MSDLSPEIFAQAQQARRSSYRGCFEDNENGKYVLGDLFHLCCAGRTTFSMESRDQTLINEGKRQVWLHIVSMINATDADIWSLAMQHVDQQRNLYQEKP